MTTISIKVPDERFKHLRTLAHHLSLERDKNISLSSLVREALDSTFPMAAKVTGPFENLLAK
jgi:hypothetical protein